MSNSQIKVQAADGLTALQAAGALSKMAACTKTGKMLNLRPSDPLFVDGTELQVGSAISSTRKKNAFGIAHRGASGADALVALQENWRCWQRRDRRPSLFGSVPIRFY